MDHTWLNETYVYAEGKSAINQIPGDGDGRNTAPSDEATLPPWRHSDPPDIKKALKHHGDSNEVIFTLTLRAVFFCDVVLVF